MTLAGIRGGDIVQADVKGDRFYAIVGGPGEVRGTLEIHPISNGRGVIRIVKARQVVGHWRARRKERGAGN